MKLLVTGRQGQIAQALAGLIRPDVTIVALGRPDVDIRDRISLDRAIARNRPDIVVNAAAYTAVDKAESDSVLAFAINAEGAGHVAAAAEAAGLPVLHLSTDYVFAGDKDDAYRETDPVAPLNVYGRSKHVGELAVAAANPAHAILRTAWVYGPHGTNFLTTMLRLAGERDSLRVVADQRGTPTHAGDLAEAILIAARAVTAAPKAENWRGLFHVAGTGETSWAGFATEIFRQSAARGGPSAHVEPIATADYPTPARRPANSRLDAGRFHTTFGHVLPHWTSGVARCLDVLDKAAP
ncbi:dTDP-4-dehydrorhamnose reductase [Phreatobacter sp. AB_2022a]|uniref:dTDP-4-dehydrorhamnose reductase n=1 Tax=Phreatobacter sp. AB_2022a TaxID=3003134 RepID=UPI00228763AE|nr:dTDP-4-dehydrorhamnose reductase [Phreatobacter sp. AB_2022a]MCZ0732766.1 dTDP-4-dehydrorhamnose reductase [Phreatobacter sp. AB_2022a]